MVPMNNGWSTAERMAGLPSPHNQRIRYTPNELAAFVRYRVPLLVVIGQAPFPELAHNVSLLYPA